MSEEIGQSRCSFEFSSFSQVLAFLQWIDNPICFLESCVPVWGKASLFAGWKGIQLSFVAGMTLLHFKLFPFLRQSKDPARAEQNLQVFYSTGYCTSSLGADGGSEGQC